MELRLADGRTLSLDHPRIVGILNVTPDSFSDGGRWTDPSSAVERAIEMARDGADLIDVGGESTRPGSTRVPAPEQIRRTATVIEAVREALDAHYPQVGISIDTTRSAVAEAALDRGAGLINDVSAGREDQAVLTLAARRGAPICLMHMKGEPGTMQDDPRYDESGELGGVVGEVEDHLRRRVEAAEAAGVDRSQIVIDAGIGFGKTREHNLALLAALPRLTRIGPAVLLGTSRKRFMGTICSRRPTLDQRERGEAPEKPTPTELVGATCATTALGVAAGVRLFRVHDVWANRQAADVAFAIGDAATKPPA